MQTGFEPEDENQPAPPRPGGPTRWILVAGLVLLVVVLLLRGCVKRWLERSMYPDPPVASDD